ncbi:MAG: calcium-binding protein, partial [Selenomonadaceae bacterium]|nr:calcium-binding protein [Selenomonadaceae bacterium]
MATAQEVIKKFMKSLDETTLSGTSALNEAIQACSGSKFSGIQDAINHMISDCSLASSANDFLINKCGIDLSNTDTGAITGSDAGGSSTKTAESVVPESGNLISFTGDSFTVKGLTIQLANWYKTSSGSYDYTTTSFNNLSSNEKYIWQSLYTWWAKESLNLIEQSYGNNFGFSLNSSATSKTMYFGFYNQSSSTLAVTPYWYYESDGETTDLGMRVNLNHYGNVSTSDPNGSSTNANSYLDRTLAHEFTHAVMAANIKYSYKLPQFIKEGMAELTHGIDDERTSLIRNLAANPSTLRNSLSLTNTGTGNTNAYAAGYMFLRYLAKQASDYGGDDINYIYNTNSTSLVSGSSGVDSIYNSGKYSTISADDGNDTINNQSSGDYSSLNGGSGNDSINAGSNSYRVTLNGGGGNDTLTGSNSTYYGDVFAFDNYYGKDVITNYSTNDTIYFSFTNGGVGYYKSGNDFLVYSGTNNDYITLKGAANKAIQIKFADGTMTTLNNDNVIINYNSNTLVSGTSSDESIYNSGYNVTINASGGNDTISNYGSSSTINSGDGNDSIYNNSSYVTIDAGYGNDTINNSNYGDYSSLSGGSGNDSINAGSNSYSVTLNGGYGNDTLIGSNSSSYGDVFQFGNRDDYDVITNYATNDTIHLTNTYSLSTRNYYSVGNDRVISLASD